MRTVIYSNEPVCARFSRGRAEFFVRTDNDGQRKRRRRRDDDDSNVVDNDNDNDTDEEYHALSKTHTRTHATHVCRTFGGYEHQTYTHKHAQTRRQTDRHTIGGRRSQRSQRSQRLAESLRVLYCCSTSAPLHKCVPDLKVNFDSNY